MTTPETLEAIRDKFMSRYEVDRNGCWIWTGTRNHAGYGFFPIKHRYFMAHRLSHEMHIGPIADGLVVMHLCDVPACINPSHLRADTPRANSQDMAQKARWRNQWINANRCKRGHEFTEVNTAWQKGSTGPTRLCRTCSSEAKRRYKMRQKARTTA